MTNSSEFGRVERALLCDYFGLPRPSDLIEVQIDQPDPDSPDAVYVPPDTSDQDMALSNAVARIALSRVQSRLPRWLTSVNGELVDTRKRYPKRKAAVALMPLHICTINWADSGPGHSWPETYNLVWLEGFQRFVVTASTDSTDVWGYEDRALGHFGRETDPIEGVRAIIVGDWRSQYESWDQERWQELLDTGALSDPESWADEVWAEETEAEEDESDMPHEDRWSEEEFQEQLSIQNAMDRAFEHDRRPLMRPLSEINRLRREAGLAPMSREQYDDWNASSQW